MEMEWEMGIENGYDEDENEDGEEEASRPDIERKEAKEKVVVKQVGPYLCMMTEPCPSTLRCPSFLFLYMERYGDQRSARTES